MKSPLAQLLLISLVVALSLWGSIKWFLSGTDEFSGSLDERSLSYLREAAPSSSKPSDQTQTSNDSTVKRASPTVYARPQPREAVQELMQAVDEEQVVKQGGGVQPLKDEPEGIVVSDKSAENGQKMVELSAAEQIALSETLAGVDKLAESANGAESEAIRLSDEELQSREDARIERLAALGLVVRTPAKPTIAIDASLNIPAQCEGAEIAKVPVGLKFRHKSSVIRGESLNALEFLVALYRNCKQGEFVLAENPLGKQDATQFLAQMRFDEVKYFFIQHSVSLDAVQFPEIK